MKLILSQAETSFNYKYLLSRIYPYIKPVMGRVILGFLVAIPLGLLDGIMAFSLRPYIDVVINGNPMVIKGFTISRDLLAAAIPWAIILFAVIQGFLKYINNYLTDWTSTTISNSVKIDLFKKLTTLDSKFYDDNSSGMVLQRFLSDPDIASRNLIESLKSLLTAATGSLGLIYVLLSNSWKLAVVGVVVLCCAFLPVALIRRKIKQVSNDSVIVGGGIMTNFTETYHGNKILTGYGLAHRQNQKFRSQIREAFDLAMSLTKRAGWMSPIMYLIAAIGVAIVMVFGNHLIISGELTTGKFASFVTSLLLLYKPVKELGGTLTGIQNIFVSMSRVFELFDLNPEITDKDDAVEFKGLNDKISFENVHFSYDGKNEVLKGITFEAKAGSIIALVGNSGGGKSTVVNLLPRFYDINEGSIKFDGINIKDFTLQSLRASISEVFQDNFLFSGTIRQNILMGNENASEEDIQRAVYGAHLNEFLDTLDNGIDTVIGERGTSLSGGQRQRVAIARAMVKDAPIIILDEATSALDNKSEAIVQSALDNLIKNKTVFVIAHRLSTIQNADKIAVINEGELAEFGTHQELMNLADGKYKFLYEMQFNKSAVTA